ncbi:MAG: DUF4147 domain-containing protein [Planctomyces sp.]|nr:DUF4147 domain-containing protein [Planctomyces sp.]
MSTESTQFSQLTRLAFDVWKAGVAAVDSALLVMNAVHFESSDGILSVAGNQYPIAGIRRIEVVGAGKAGAGMASGLEESLRELPPFVQKSGWINVPADCVRSLSWIQVHPARPAGLNEPTDAGIIGSREIIRRVHSLNPADLCIVLISGGGSALLCLPADGLTLADKLKVTRLLASSGAPIQELNLVRTQLSGIKGGRLAAACNSKIVETLVISDVEGDPLHFIASGPTVPTELQSLEAMRILRTRCHEREIPESVTRFLAAQALNPPQSIQRFCDSKQIRNTIIGNNRTAVQAAENNARSIGCQMIDLNLFPRTGIASENGAHVASQLTSLRADLNPGMKRGAVHAPQLLCAVGGGEATVQLSTSGPIGRGGRNQEFVLSAIAHRPNPADWNGIVLLSGGTDGEDGPTDAAGAFADENVVRRMAELRLDPFAFLQRNDAYTFFEQTGGLLKTGPTHTNVMDLQVLLIER